MTKQGEDIYEGGMLEGGGRMDREDKESEEVYPELASSCPVNIVYLVRVVVYYESFGLISLVNDSNPTTRTNLISVAGKL